MSKKSCGTGLQIEQPLITSHSSLWCESSRHENVLSLAKLNRVNRLLVMGSLTLTGTHTIQHMVYTHTHTHSHLCNINNKQQLLFHE